jgi:3-hydroxyacyl-CoA dehydrogenase/enoyl-CoA hydratase/3-hydroxybutyryl-CoA epimerase
VSSNFRLDIESSGLATLVFDTPGKSANVFTHEAVEELAMLVERLAVDSTIKCLVLLSAKPRIFIAGADIEGIAGVEDSAEAEAAGRMGQKIFQDWEDLPFPTIAAVSGTCAGGGTEISLASDLLLLSDRPDIRIGLPETKLGIVPGWGGCTRMPLKIGLANSLDLILGGKMIRPKKAFKIGLADALLPEANFRAEVRRIAEQTMAGSKSRKRKSGLKSVMLEKNPLDEGTVPGPTPGDRSDQKRHRRRSGGRLRSRGSSHRRTCSIADLQEPRSPVPTHGEGQVRRPCG